MTATPDPTKYAHSSRQRPELLVQKRPGEHVWVVIASYVVSIDTVRRQAEDGPGILDGENLAAVDIGCFICERPYSEYLSHRKCTGEPS